MGWHEAKAFCEKKGATLAVVTSSGEQNFLANTFTATSPNTSIWLGATDEITEGTWKWVTGETWSYTAWGGGQPDNWAGMFYGNIMIDEDYLTLWSGSGVPWKWNDAGYAAKGVLGWGLASTLCEWAL